MTHQDFLQNSSSPTNVSSIKQTSSRVALQVSMLSALVLLGGVTGMTLPAQSNTVPGIPLAQTPAGASIIYVNPATGTDAAGAGTSEAAPYRTIAYALASASSGTIVQLAPGSYTSATGEVFPLVVKEGVSLRGDVATKGQRTGIIGGGLYGSPTAAGQNITLRAENNSEISGISVTNPNTRGTGVWIESTNAAIRNNTFSNS